MGEDLTKARILVPTGHNEGVAALDLSADGRYALSVSRDKLLIIWDLRTGLELFQIEFEQGLTAAAFAPNGQQFAIATGQLFDNIHLWDFEKTSPQLLRTFHGHGHHTSRLLFSADGTQFYSAAWDGQVKIWKTATGNLVQSWKAHPKEIQALARTSDDQYLATGAFDFTVKIWEAATGKLLHTLTEHRSNVMAVAFSPDGSRLASTDYSGKVIEWDWQKGTPTFEHQQEGTINNVTYSHDGKWLAFDGTLLDATSKQVIRTVQQQLLNVNALRFSPDDKLILTAGSFADASIKVWTRETGNLLRELRGHTEVSAVIPLSDREVLTASLLARYPFRKKLCRWNLAQGTMEVAFEASPDRTYTSFALSKDKKWIALGQGSTKMSEAGEILNDFFIEVKALDQLDTVATVLNGHAGLIQAVAFSPDRKILASVGGEVPRDWQLMLEFDPNQPLLPTEMDTDIRLWNIATGQQINILKGHTAPVNNLTFSPDGKYLLSAGLDGVTRIWNAATGKAIKSTTAGSPAIFIQNGRQVATRGQVHTLLIWEVVQYQSTPIDLKTSSFPVALGWSESKQQLLAGMMSGELFLWDLEKETLLQTFSGHSNQIASIEYLPDQNRWLTTAFDGTMKLWESQHTEPVATYIAVDRADWLTFSPDFHYTCSKNAARQLGFAIGKDSYLFEQFDRQFNRPDVVMQCIGLADSSLIHAHRKACERRMALEGLPLNPSAEMLMMPSFQIENVHAIPLSSPQRKLSFQVKADGNGVPLQNIQVTINDVPIQTLDLAAQNTTTFKGKIEVILSTGSNKINLSCLTAQGVESLKSSFEVTYEGDGSLPDLYLLVIGASEYQDATANLKYPAKDAQDVADLFAEKAADYGEIHLQILANEQVNATKIQTLKTWLQGSNVDDKVLLFYAGHGVLDANHELFLSTYDMNFSDPAQQGISYHDLEQLLEGIPARKRLLLLDACHTGEIDKSVPMKAQVAPPKPNFRGMGRKYYPTQARSSFDLMKSLFVDFRNRTGAVVIAGASGTQVAFEGDQWQNGAFTYCLLEGLKMGYADLDGDGKVSVSELQAYLERRVLEATEGRQQPVMRREFLVGDWGVW